MKRRLFLIGACAFLISTPTITMAATDPIEGILPLVKDDLTAVARIKTMPERHVR
jgi:hypothetical protein